MRSSAKDVMGIKEFNIMKEQRINKFNELQSKKNFDFLGKKFFTLEEVDSIISKYYSECEKIDVYDWYFRANEPKGKLDSLDCDSFHLAEGTYYENRKYFLYKKRGTIKCGRDCGFIIFADENGFFYSSFHFGFMPEEVKIILDYLKLLCRDEV